LDTIVVILIVCLAAGYLVRRYIERSKNAGGCACENMECPLKGSGSGLADKNCDGMIYESKTGNNDPAMETAATFETGRKGNTSKVKSS